MRSATPAARSYTPALPPPVPQIPNRYAATPTPSPMRAYTPAPSVPPKPRRLSTSSPPKMLSRSMSEEKADAHERWLPAELANDPNKMRGFSSAHHAAARLRDLNLKSPIPY